MFKKLDKERNKITQNSLCHKAMDKKNMRVPGEKLKKKLSKPN